MAKKKVSGSTARELADAIRGTQTKAKQATVAYGTVTQAGADAYVTLDGATSATPVSETAAALSVGDRVAVRIEGGSMAVTGNMSDPAAGSQRVQEAEAAVSTLVMTAEELSNTIEGVEGGYSRIKQTVDSVSTEVAAYDGRITAVEQTADKVETTVTGLDGRMSQIKQTADGILMYADDGSGDGFDVDDDTDISAAIKAASDAATAAQAAANTAKTDAASAKTTASSAYTKASNAASDASDAINAAASAANTAKSYLTVSSGGLVVSQTASSSSYGSNVFINSSGVNIRSGTTTLGTFGSYSGSFYDYSDDGGTPAATSYVNGINIGSSSGLYVSTRSQFGKQAEFLAGLSGICGITAFRKVGLADVSLSTSLKSVPLGNNVGYDSSSSECDPAGWLEPASDGIGIRCFHNGYVLVCGAFYFDGVTDGDSVWCRVRRYRSGTYSVVSLGGNIRASAPSSTKDTGVAQCVPNVFKVKNGDWLELAAMNNTASRGVIPSASGNASSTYLTVIYLT